MLVAISACRRENHYVINLRDTLEMIDTIEKMGYYYNVATGVHGGVEEIASSCTLMHRTLRLPCQHVAAGDPAITKSACLWTIAA